MTSSFEAIEEKSFLIFDAILIAASIVGLTLSFFFHIPWADDVLAALSFLGLIPVAYNAIHSLIKKQLSVDLLASIALAFSLISYEWFSAAFITLMLAFARLFDRITAARAKRVIQGLMKYHVEKVRIQVGERFKEVHIKEVKPGDHVIVQAGDRMPVDGLVISGTADVDESSLTGESELVSKKAGDKVFTATMSEAGSLVVKVERVGADTTLSKIINLIQEASRDKNKAERMADRFTQWYILLTLIASAAMYMYGLTPRTILSVLLVVCADDIAVAVPLGFTAAIARAAKRGVIVKGSAAFEQISKMKYVLTDKTGTLTKGMPQVVEVKAYGSVTVNTVLDRAAMGASESHHAVSHAILAYANAKGMKAHAPSESSEVSGQGISFRHGTDRMFLGRLTLMEKEKCRVPEALRKDVEKEKDSGKGIVILALNREAVGLITYRDELRPRVREIIAETKKLGVLEWHMLTGDNERAAAAVSHELGIRHFHADMTPEGKVDFIRKFEKEHGKKSIVGYIGDGVNDAASLALADVSIAMGGIGADSAIEAADITIMKDKLDRLPETMRIAIKVRRVMWQNFAIWAIMNIAGLGLVAFGFIGPVGAATYNFVTDFFPIGNALRAGRGKETRKD